MLPGVYGWPWPLVADCLDCPVGLTMLMSDCPPLQKTLLVVVTGTPRLPWHGWWSVDLTLGCFPPPIFLVSAVHSVCRARCRASHSGVPLKGGLFFFFF